MRGAAGNVQEPTKEKKKNGSANAKKGSAKEKKQSVRRKSSSRIASIRVRKTIKESHPYENAATSRNTDVGCDDGDEDKDASIYDGWSTGLREAV
ncbi:hypothetical protein C1H76_4047 [Elsinoe australis]|uniref:Uncharacterized protein n=1 Tax=Elsinoe australis TaxID=40998 RepID=A0A4U7B1M2_9PEZI|nr:hypothetical protein C1H76_4047 [Elsinoe australis]